MRLARAVLCVALAGALSLPAWAEVRIEGDPVAAAGRMVRLRAAGDVRDAALIWDVSDEEALDLEEVGDRLLLTGPKGVYKVKLRAVRLVGGKATVETARVTVTIGEGKPDPVPPGPRPGPQPPPAPLRQLWMIWVEETADATKDRGKLLSDKALNDRVRAKGHRWRVVDKDAVNSDGRPPADLAPWIERGKKAGLPRLYLVDQDGRILDEGPAPKDAAEALKRVEKVGG